MISVRWLSLHQAGVGPYSCLISFTVPVNSFLPHLVMRGRERHASFPLNQCVAAQERLTWTEHHDGSNVSGKRRRVRVLCGVG